METNYYSQEQTKEVSELLKKGGIVALPTDTVYGLGVIANNEKSINLLKKIKNRPEEKAFAYMVDSLNKIEQVCELSERDKLIIKRYLPGPFTFIFNQKKDFNLVNESNLETLAIRIPDHPFILEVISLMDTGLYVPSANISSQTPAITSREVGELFDHKIDGIVMGHAFNGVSSTIVDCTSDELKILREGPIPFTWRNYEE